MTKQPNVSQPSSGTRAIDVSPGEIVRPGVFPRSAPHRVGYPPRWAVLLGLVVFCAAVWAAAFWIVFSLI